VTTHFVLFVWPCGTQGEVARKSYDKLRTYDTAIWIKLGRNSELGQKGKELHSNERKCNRENTSDSFTWHKGSEFQAQPSVSCSQLPCRNVRMQSNFPCCDVLAQHSASSSELYFFSSLQKNERVHKQKKTCFLSFYSSAKEDFIVEGKV